MGQIREIGVQGPGSTAGWMGGIALPVGVACHAPEGHIPPRSTLPVYPTSPLAGPTTRIAAALLILLPLSACDNVEWGGVEVELRPPPEKIDTTAAAVDSTGIEEAAGPVLPEGYAVFMGERMEGNRVRIRPVAEIGPDTLMALPREVDQPGSMELFARERMARGTAFTLFAEGSRVGTVRLDSVQAQPGLCAPVPVGFGTLEMVPDANEATRFIAVNEAAAGNQRYTPFVAPDHNLEQRSVGVDLAASAIRSVGAAFPGAVLDMRADFQAFPLDGDPRGAFAGTFLYQDALRVGDPLTEAAYDLFIIGVQGPRGWELGYRDYRPVRDGKAAQRFFESADWDGDGESEILVELFGTQSRWVMGLDRKEGSWYRAFEESCAPLSPAP